jgi:transcription elongation factor GreA
MAPGSPRPGAADLMRSLGLLVHGPQVWATPPSGRAPGVFVVELPASPERAPIDSGAVRRWLEHVPQLTLDGSRPAPPALAARLAEFWLPGEPVLFVGRSSRSVGQRLAAIYATPLGDARPSALGYWLKTLSVLRHIRVWWAATDAHEEYEDALLEEIAARNDGRLPFANLASPSAGARQTGLAGALRAPDDTPIASPGRPKSGPTRTATLQRQAAPSARRSAAAAPRRPRTVSAATAASPPVPEPTYLSEEGAARLTAELEDLRTNVRPQVIARVKAARELGDLRENGDYEAARKEQSFVEGRIQTLEALLRSSRLIDASEPADSVRLGSTVEVEVDGQRETYVLVGAREADPAAGRLSHRSPVGQALLGARPGDEVVVDLPRVRHAYRVIAVR